MFCKKSDPWYSSGTWSNHEEHPNKFQEPLTKGWLLTCFVLILTLFKGNLSTWKIKSIMELNKLDL